MAGVAVSYRAEPSLVDKPSTPLLPQDAPPLNNLTSPPPRNSRSIAEPPCIPCRLSRAIMLGRAGSRQGAERGSGLP